MENHTLFNEEGKFYCGTGKIFKAQLMKKVSLKNQIKTLEDTLKIKRRKCERKDKVMRKGTRTLQRVDSLLDLIADVNSAK